jgi:6-phosphogluconolactonase
MENGEEIQSIDNRRDIIIPGSAEETVLFCVDQFLQIGQDAIAKNGHFAVAVSGGSTPNAIFKKLCDPQHAHALDWSKVLLFWSDERSVPPNDPESNYFNAMQAGLSKIGIPPENVFRMHAEKKIEENALAYEQLIREKVTDCQFDLVMLGMGEDGHTASLFPRTQGLGIKNRLVIANYIPQKRTWRMTFTYELIHKARTICIYVMGAEKAPRVAKIFTGAYDPDNLPIQKIGIPSHKALWILDAEAGRELVRTSLT